MATNLKRPPLPPGVAHAQRSAILMVSGVLASGFPLPYTAVALVPLVWAGAESVRSIRERSAAKHPARAMVSTILTLVLAGMLTVMVLLPYAFYGAQKRLQDCNLGANTAIAAADCKSRYGGLELLPGDLLRSG